MRARELYEGRHLPRQRVPGAVPAALLPHTRVLPKRRYDLRLPPHRAFWSGTSSGAMASVFGDDELARTTLALYQSSLSARSYENYGSCLKGYLLYCDEQGLDPLEATPPEIARYVGWLGLRGSVAADSLQPYLSAINRFQKDHNRPPTALGPLVTAVRRGLANSQVDTEPTETRVPLPPHVALAILEKAELLLPRVNWTASTPDLLLLRACTAVITSYVFFCRGECGALVLRSDLYVDDSHITLQLSNEKGKKGNRVKTVRQITASNLPRVAALLRAFCKGTAYRGSFERRWALSFAEDTALWSAATISTWLQLAYESCGLHPPEGFAWLSHSLRKGAASAAHAIQVILTVIRFMGGWATNSNVLEAKYIDYAMRPSAAAHLFFGHLRQDEEGTYL